MRQVTLPVPELAAIAATRAVGGAGAALLLSRRVRPGKRRRIGWILLAIGVASTVPLLLDVLRRSKSEPTSEPEYEPQEV